MDQTTYTQPYIDIMDFRAYEAAPGISVIILPDAPTYTHVAASNDFFRASGMKRADVIGKGHFAVFPKSPDDPNFTGELNLRASFEYIIQQKEPHEIPVQRYDIPNGDGTFRQKYWKINNAPILSNTGEVLYIVHTAADITDQVLAKQREDRIKELEKSHHLFMQAPVVIGIVTGDNYVIELANDDLLQVWGRAADVIGKPLFEAIPELLGQGFKELLNGVKNTGEPFFAFEHPIKLVRSGKEEVVYFDFVYKPFYDEGQDKAAGVFAVGHNITKQVEARQKFKNIIEQATDPILILKGEDMVLEVANEALFRLWKVDSTAIGKAFLEILPEMKGQGFLELLQQVYHTGEPFHGYEVPAIFEEGNGKTRKVYFNFTYQPYREADGSITGVLVLATDVSGQVLAQRQVAESQEELKQFKFMADQARDPFILMREDGTFAYLNRKALDAWGYTEEEAKGIRVPDVNPIYNDELFSQAFARAQKEEIPTFETLHKRKDGHIYPVEVNMNGITLNGIPYMFAVARDITERKRADEAIKQSENNLRSVIQQAPVAMLIFRDENMIFDTVNTAMLRLLEKTGEIVGKPVLDVLPEIKDQPIHQILSNVYHTGQPYYGYEWLVTLTRNGKLEDRYFNFAYTPFIENGKVVGVMEVATEVTEHVNARKKIEDSHKELQFVMNIMPTMVWHTLPDGSADYFNQVYLDYTGLTTDQLTGNQWTSLLHPEDVEATGKIWQQALVSGDQYEVEHRLRGKDGNYCWFLTLGVSLRNDKGEITKWYGTSTNIQEQKEKEARFRLMANSLPIVIWTASPDGGLTFISDQWEAEWGNSIAESLGTGWAKYVHPDDIDRAAKIWSHSLQSGEDYETEFRVLYQGSEYRWLLVRAIPIRGTDGQIMQWYGSNTEIQDKKHFEEQLERRVKERTQELEQFTYVSHHDLQEPLRKIVLFSDMVRSEASDKLSEAAQNRLDRVINAAQRMSVALRDVLDFASLSKEEQFKPVDLEEVLASVYADLELVISEKKAKITSDPLPTIKAVPGQMHQLFYNLLSNALKFAKRDQLPVVTITSKKLSSTESTKDPELERGKIYFEITVSDNGIGFRPDFAEKIFSMFQRLNSKEAYAGTGIGLALCKKVVQNHGGKIWAEGIEGEGATFKILLPAN